MFKHVVKQIMGCGLKLVHCFWNYTIYSSVLLFVNKIYSQWISLELKSNSGFIKTGLTLVGGKCISIGKDTLVETDAVLSAWNTKDGAGIQHQPNLEIGDNCFIGQHVHITCINHVRLSNRVLIGRWVTISDNNHGYTDMLSLQKPPIEREWVSKGPVIIEDNVWIGDKATILANVTIGKGAVVAANSVVTKDVPAYSVVAGIPAKVIKTN